jgi:fluoride exporter
MNQALLNSLLVGIGGAAGSLARYGLAVLLQRHSLVFPLGTLAANLAGCFVIGCVAELAAPLALLPPATRLLLGTGFCGGFTTLSSMIYEVAQFLRDGEYFHAGIYIVGSLAGSLILFFLGVVAVRMIFKSTGGLWN